MYLPRHFEESDPATLAALMREHPFAAVVAMTPSGIEANHFPLHYAAAPAPLGTLRGHMARGNPLWRTFDAAHEVLAIFQGAQGYITPSWYPAKRVDGQVVPTWNYAVVHVRGELKPVEDPSWLMAHLDEMVSTHEARQASPWAMADAPADYIGKLVAGIVGFEITVKSITGKWKASQNRSAADREGVMSGLQASGDPDSERLGRLVRASHRRE